MRRYTMRVKGCGRCRQWAFNLAVLGNLDDVYRVIEEHRPDVICLGYDQNSFTERLPIELKKRDLNAVIVRLPPYREHEFKSSIIKKQWGSDT